MEHCVYLAVCVGVFAATIYLALTLAAKYMEFHHHTREPPLVKPVIPLLGHAIGIARQGPKYFQSTSTKTSAPIYTLKFLTNNVYVVTSPNLVNTVSKNTRALSFNPFIAEVAIRLTHCSEEARAIIEHNIDGSEGRDSYVLEIHDHAVVALAPGPQVERLNLLILQDCWTYFLKPFEDSTSGSRIGLHATIRHMITVSSTNAIYGPENPVSTNPRIEKAFWDFDANLDMLLMNIYPALTARKGNKARKLLTLAFRDYFDSGVMGRSSYLTEGRHSIAKKHNFSDIDVARVEVGNMIGILVNTVPTLFYLLLHIFSDDSLLVAIRREIIESAIRKSDDANKKPCLILSAVRSHCMLLHSTFQETLRSYSEGATVRLVCEDTMLDGQYLLKKGSILQMPNSVIHRDKIVWGDTSFQPRRFMKQDNTEKKPDVSGTTSAGAYRPFGGGATLCPGRHLATNEIMGLAALIVWRFDMEPVGGKGWVFPKPKQDSVVEAVFPPSHDIDVLIRKRDIQEGLPEEWDIATE